MKPVFMFGFERSGTTLLSMMVGAHPEVAVPLSTAGMWYQLYQIYRAMPAPADFQTAGFVDDTLRHPRIQLWDQELCREEILAGIDGANYGSVVSAFHQNYALKCNKSCWTSMDISTIDNMDLVNQWMPDARFVHIVRDGRDVALSHQHYAYGAGNIAECADKWRIRVERNLKMGAMIEPARYHVVRYEDLIQTPEETLSIICGFMGIDYSPLMLEYSESVRQKVPDEKRFLWPDLDKAPDQAKIYRWKRQMTAPRRIVFEARASALLDTLGYETLDDIPKSARASLLEFVYFFDKGHRWKRMKKKMPFLQRK